MCRCRATASSSDTAISRNINRTHAPLNGPADLNFSTLFGALYLTLTTNIHKLALICSPALAPKLDPKAFEAEWDFSSTSGFPTPNKDQLKETPNFSFSLPTIDDKKVKVKPEFGLPTPDPKKVTEALTSRFAFDAMAKGATASSAIDGTTKVETDNRGVIEKWVRARLLTSGYCHMDGRLRNPVNMDQVRSMLHKDLPDDAREITAVLKILDEEFISNICQEFPVNAHGKFHDTAPVIKKMMRMRREFGKNRAAMVVLKWQEQNANRLLAAKTEKKPTVKNDVAENIASKTRSKTKAGLTNEATRSLEPPEASQKAIMSNASSLKSAQNNGRDEELEQWVRQQFLNNGFTDKGFKGFAKFTKNTVALRPERREDIILTIKKLRQTGHMLSFGDTEALFRARIAERKLKGTEQKKGGIQAQQSLAASSSAKVAGAGSGLLDLSEHAPPATSLKPSVSANSVTAANRPANNDLLTTTFNSFRIANGSRVASDDEYTETDTSHDDYEECEYSEVLEDNNLSSDEQKRGIPYAPDYDHIDLLVPDEIDHDHTDERYAGADAEIKHAPIISGDMITDEHQELLPQYGFLGLGTRDKSKLFLNTNVPFSAFICGVQGSGKSHTTSCLLENVLIPSKHLGRLENPLSALVFSYGHFSGDGSGFNISEVASLAAAHPSFAGHPHVKKITVLVSPSNPSIAKLYRKVPNVTVIPYKLKPWNLDIDIMLTLMAVNESDDQPLYMAQVTNILRDMATNGDGRLNYGLFKKRIEQCNFNPVQVNMLQLRLNLLESFLDLKNTCSEPSFRPGEITIMDMSCPFVDANTACILFKIGLQRYLQSNAPGKMIVLDEAHKYMLRNPGAIALNENLLQVIRLQRHFGARVIISTQEPTLLTDLIALCSITIIHRFSSPEWFSALKKHIPMSIHDHTKLLLDIEGLRTGTALVYSTGAVLGKNEDGSLIKGTGKMIRVAIRKRVTSDGGQSVLAV